MHCGHKLSALDLVPVASYLFIRGRCRYCSARISLQYPLVELVGASLSLGTFLVQPSPLPYTVAFLLWMTLLFLVTYDLRHLSLPIPALWTVGVLGLLSTTLSCSSGSICAVAVPPLVSLVAGPIIALPLLLFSALSGERWMGWGDGFLALGLGWFVGLTGGVTALCFAFWGGAFVGLSLVALSRRRVTMTSEIPFAPFLMFGAAIVYFFHIDLFSILLV